MRKKFCILLLLALFLNFTDRVVGLSRIKRGVGMGLEPLQLGMIEARVGVRAAGSFLGSLPIVYRENLQLREDLVEYQRVEIENRGLVEENRILREQLGAGLPEEWMPEPVKVVGFTEKAGEELALIRGQVSLGSVVIWGQKLIGEIVSTDGPVSQVRTIYSSQSRVAVEIVSEEGIAQALAEGKFSSEVHITNILLEKGVDVGDLVVTSGAVGKYPRGLVLGTIEEIFEKSGDVYKSARLKLSWGLRDLRTVFVIK